MFSFRLVSIVLLAAFLSVAIVACGDDDDDGGPTAPVGNGTSTQQATEASSPEGPEFEDEQLLNVFGTQTADYTNLMDYTAQEILAERGIEMEIRVGFDREVSLQQVVEGRAQLTPGNIISQVPAVNAGAPLKSYMNHSGQSFFYVSTPGITEPSELSGTTFGVHSEVSYTKSVTDALIEKYDLDDVDILIVPGSEVRLQALLQGDLDATTVDVADLVRVRAEDPDAISVLSTVSEEFPGLLYSTALFNSDWVEENPEVARAVVEAYVMAAERLNSDREYALALAEEIFPEEVPSAREGIIDEYLRLGLWNACDISGDQVSTVLDFMYTYGQLDEDPSNYDTSDYFDPQFHQEFC